MPRPRLDPAITQRVVDLIRAGNYIDVAAAASGIHRTTLHRWMRLGRAQTRGHYRKFLIAVERALAESESRDVTLIAKAAVEDWRAAAWRLERRSPKKYGPRVQISVHEALDGMMERLKRGFDEAMYARVLALITADDLTGVDSPDAPATDLLGESSGLAEAPDA